MLSLAPCQCPVFVPAQVLKLISERGVVPSVASVQDAILSMIAKDEWQMATYFTSKLLRETPEADIAAISDAVLVDVLSLLAKHGKGREALSILNTAQVSLAGSMPCFAWLSSVYGAARAENGVACLILSLHFIGRGVPCVLSVLVLLC